jgi:ABC-type bacteriocin/lantibiotic exporter with double-glycine peptidase domain
VVFEQVTKSGIVILDPSQGRRHVREDELARRFTGIALTFELTESFQSEGKEPDFAWRFARTVLQSDGLLPRIVVTTLILQLFVLATPVLTGAIVDQVVPNRDYRLMVVLEAGLVSFMAFYFLGRFVRGHLLLHLRTRLDMKMTIGFLAHVVRLPYAFFQLRSPGDLMARLYSNVNIRDVLANGALSAVLDGTMVFLYLILLLVVSPKLALVVTALAIGQVMTFLLIRKRQFELQAEGLRKQAETRAYHVDLFTGIETIKAMGCEDGAVRRFSDLFIAETNVAVAGGKLNALFDALLSTLGVSNPLLTLAFGAHLVLDGKLTLGSMLAINALANNFLTPVVNLVRSAQQVSLLGTYYERIDDVLQSAPEQADGVGARRRLSGRIALEQVSFSYGKTLPPVLRDVSVDVRPGQFVAIVGPSAAGKSTLGSLLFGLYQPAAGRILYDGLDLNGLDVRSVRQQMGIVTQRTVLFGGSIRDNITMRDDSIPLDQVIGAAQLAALDEEINAMPMGYHTLLLDGGASLSGGQRQRLALARALVRKPRILLLDEATSALDTATEGVVQRALASLECTRIVIAHRLSTIMNADLILVMDNGRIVERGTHEELVRGGLYRKLVTVQSTLNTSRREDAHLITRDLDMPDSATAESTPRKSSRE